jgi:hypothetical protein
MKRALVKPMIQAPFALICTIYCGLIKILLGRGLDMARQPRWNEGAITVGVGVVRLNSWKYIK